MQTKLYRISERITLANQIALHGLEYDRESVRKFALLFVEKLGHVPGSCFSDCIILANDISLREHVRARSILICERVDSFEHVLPGICSS